MEPIVITVSFFAAIFGIMYMYYTTRNKERMALIEKGADASVFYPGKEKKGQINWGRFTLKTGMFFMGIGAGIIVAAIMSNAGVLNEGANYPSMIFLFGGLSLVLFYIIDRKNK